MLQFLNKAQSEGNFVEELLSGMLTPLLMFYP
jgi:hypothetical protein